MLKQRKRIVNFRSLFIIALFVIASIFAALITYNYIALGVFIITLILGSAVFLFVFYKRSRVKFVTFLLCFVLSALSFSIFTYTAQNFNNEKFFFPQYARVVGMVESDVSVDGERVIILSDISFSGRSEKGKLCVYTGDGAEFRSGAILSFTAKISAVRLIVGFKVNGYAFRSNIRYSCYANGLTEANQINYKSPGVLIKTREFIAKRLLLAMGEKYSALAFGMLTGDKSHIDYDTYNTFSLAGITHILAVSGMHLSFIALIIAFVLKKLRVRRLTTAIITTVVLLFYSALAAFSPSVLRSLIMSLIGLYVYLFGNHRDPLSALSAAVSLILSFAPLFLFEAGFVLSVTAVLGLILFYNAFNKAFRKIKLPKAIAAPIAFNLSIQLGILPAALYYFKYFHVYSIIINLLIIPIFTLTFTAIVISLILSIIIPEFLLPLTICGLGLGFIDLIAGIAAHLPMTRIVLFSSGAAFLCYTLYFVMSRFVMLRGKKIITPVCIALCVLFVLINSQSPYSNAALVPLDTQYGYTSIVTTKDENYLVGDIGQASTVLRRLKANKVQKLDGIFITRMDESAAAGVLKIAYFYTDFTVYFPYDFINYYGGGELLIGKTDIFKIESGGEIRHGFSAIFDDDGKFLAYDYSGRGSKILFLEKDADYLKVKNISGYTAIRSYYYLPNVDGGAIQFFNGMFELTDDYLKNFYFDYSRQKIIFV